MLNGNRINPTREQENCWVGRNFEFIREFLSCLTGYWRNVIWERSAVILVVTSEGHFRSLWFGIKKSMETSKVQQKKKKEVWYVKPVD